MTSPWTPAGVVKLAGRVLTDARTIGVAQAAPRTAMFMARAWAQGRLEEDDEAVVPRLSLGLAAQVLLDEVAISALRNPRLRPEPSDYLRAGRDIAAADAMWQREGWLDDPARYHDDPGAPHDWALRPGQSFDQRYDKLTFPSGYRPHPGEPGEDRWLDRTANRTVHAHVVRHHGAPRPWLVCVHGFGMGQPQVDFYAFRIRHLYRRLGMNVMLPVLPLHGPRQNPGAPAGEGFMSIDLLDVVHGMTQAARDVRAAIRWIRQTDGDVPIGLYGISLGGYVAALVASLEDGLSCVIAGIPATDMPDLYRRHSGASVRHQAREAGAFGPAADRVASVISPLVLSPRPPRDRRYVFAGVGDRLSTARQARRLWEHWERPRAIWYGGGHLGFIWAGEVARFVNDAVVESGLATHHRLPPAE